MENNINKLVVESKKGDSEALMTLIEYFNSSIEYLIRTEKKESQNDYRQMLISELTIQVYELDENKVKNPKAYLKACLKSYFIKINKWSKLHLDIENEADAFESDTYDIYERNQLDEYLKVLEKFLNKRQLEIFKMRVIENKSVRDISRFYNVSENNIYKILKNIKTNLANNKSLREVIINEFLYT